MLLKNADLISESSSRGEAVRKLIMKMVNRLIAKLETGRLKICLHLLNHSDHYTDQ